MIIFEIWATPCLRHAERGGLRQMQSFTEGVLRMVLCATPAYGTQSEADSVTKGLGCGTTVCFAAKPRKYQHLNNLFFDKL